MIKFAHLINYIVKFRQLAIIQAVKSYMKDENLANCGHFEFLSGFQYELFTFIIKYTYIARRIFRCTNLRTKVHQHFIKFS